MAIGAITYNFFGTQILAKMTPTSASNGFDVATMRVDCKGDENRILADYPRGGKCAYGANMYYTGIQIEEQSDGWTTATVFAKGFWEGTPTPVETVASNYTELLYPFQNGTTIYALPGTVAGATTALNPNNGNAPYRIRKVLEEGVLTRTGVAIKTGAGDFAYPGKPTGTPRPSFLGTEKRITEFKDPLLSTEIGWVRQSFTPSIEICGPISFISWSDTWRWFDRVTL